MKEINRRQCLGGLLVTGAAAGVASCGCRSAPYTGRKQLLIYPEGKEMSLGSEAYGEVTKETPLSENPQYTAMVQRVGERIAAVAGRSDFQWEFKTLQSEEQNAFCLPGGKVAVYEGILPVCQNEAGLAVVMGHEIAHALARHGGERMSQNAAVQGVQTAASYILQNQEETKKEMIFKAYGMATEYGVLLPFSRKHESEADEIGITLMANAGYDPAEAPKFWTRFGAAGTGEKQPEFLSTHPSDERRSQDLEALLPGARELYEQAAEKVGLGEAIS
ncbi:M48 family metallopeptidase [Rosistilla oblonga]|uniref:M48 family metallopeptidase n=1 Tax=Rosistilla oblonga TaxID=2527990 RepID=UPI003A97383B